MREEPPKIVDAEFKVVKEARRPLPPSRPTSDWQYDKNGTFWPLGWFSKLWLWMIYGTAIVSAVFILGGEWDDRQKKKALEAEIMQLGLEVWAERHPMTPPPPLQEVRRIGEDEYYRRHPIAVPPVP